MAFFIRGVDGRTVDIDRERVKLWRLSGLAYDRVNAHVLEARRLGRRAPLDGAPGVLGRDELGDRRVARPVRLNDLERVSLVGSFEFTLHPEN